MLSNTFTLSDFTAPANFANTGGSLLRSGDLQGRSMRLGQPLIVRAPSQIQPEVILGHPPMHVDYILPNEGTSSTIFNMSVLPDEYYTQYDLDSMSSTTSSSTSTTSYSYAMSESVTEKVKFQVPLVSSISGTFTQAWGQTYDSTTSHGANSFQRSTLDVSTSTGFGDELWLSTYDFNVYLYPVIGQTVCPEGENDCTSSEQGPLYVQYSGPDQVEQLVTNGPAAEWYQPVFEPGQVFSYPWDTDQLAYQIANPQPLTEITFYVTDNSGETASAMWSSGTGTNQTSGTTQEQSFDTSNSVTVGTPNLEKAVGGGASVTTSYDYADSTANSTLNTSSSQVQSSTGVTVVKPKDFAAPDFYAYAFSPILLGQPLSNGNVQGSLTDQQINSSGPFWTAFLADPTATEEGAGSWWSVSPYAQDFDIALNHPQRYTATHSNPDWPSSCIALSEVDITDCAQFNFPDPDDLWSSGFYSMRGLLVTVDSASGPQRVTATAGDTVYLQARVYNYSLTDLTTSYPDAVVYVRFYRQPWDVSTQAPVAGEDSVLIAENTLPPIPAFNSTTTPNWTLTSASFSTTGLEDTYQVFWVVAWAEDGSGNLLSELVGHGLSADPDSVTINGITDVPLEMVEGIPVSTPQLPTFSNNLGLLQQAFYVAEPTPTPTTSTSSSAVAAGRRVTGPTGAALRVEDVEVSDRNPALGDRVTLRANIRALDAPADGFMVSYFDTDPSQTNRAFDVDLVSHIRAGETYQVRVPYLVQKTGTHQLFVVADRGRERQALGQVTFVVPAEPTPTASPSATPSHSPTATATARRAGSDDDGCAIRPGPRRASDCFLLLPAVALLGVARRWRRGG